MGGQIVRRKKKGRPSKADLARRAALLTPASAAVGSERRRSMRRRNVRYNNFIDYDDYLDEFEDFSFQEEEVGVREEEGEEEDEEEEEEARRKEKKLKLVLNLHVQKQGRGRRRRKGIRRARAVHAREPEPTGAISGDEEEDEVEEEREEKPLKKKRRVNGGSEDEVVADSGNDDEEEEDGYRRNDDDDDDDAQEGRGRKGDDGRGEDSIPGTPTDHRKALPLPDKKSLELILDKLQKKDIYGVYAEPVDLEELPDYLDVIDHPMDFATVRKKLANGSYATIEQFESDVFLICSNAMQYNSSDTVYYKQARTIQELAKKKFQKIRIKIERSESAEKEMKSEQKTKSNFLVKKQVKKPFGRSVHEPVGSDFSSGATLATPGDIPSGSAATQGGGYERTINTDVHAENSSMADNNIEKAEELSSGKGLLSRFGRKPSLPEDRRATYNVSNQPVVRSESVFTTFDSEIKQLVTVGLHADYSYARSLARFAATLGPVAWKVASQRIEHVLPPGYKYGRGWVGEYEPLPTPVLKIETRYPKELLFPSKFHCTSDPRNGDATPRASAPSKEHPSRGHTSEGKPSLLNSNSRLAPGGRSSVCSSAVTRPITPVSSSYQLQNLPLRNISETQNPTSFLHPTSRLISEGKPSANSSTGTKPITPVGPPYQQQNLPPRNFPEKQNKSSKRMELNLPPSSNKHGPDLVQKLPPRKVPDNQSKSSKRVELNLPPSSNQHDSDVVEKLLPDNSEVPGPKSREMSHRVIPKHPDGAGVSSGGLPNGKVATSSFNSKMVTSSSDGVHSPLARPANYFPQPQGQNQGLTDPVEAMRISAQMAQIQQNYSDLPSTENPPAVPLVSSVRNDSNNAAAAAARAWMSIGAGGFRPPTENSVLTKDQISAESLYNPARQLHPQITQVQGQFVFPAGVQIPSEKNNFPFQAFIPQPVHGGDGGHLQNRPMIFPQLVATDLSRFQLQYPWRGLSLQAQPKQKPDTLPPDLNIGFQSPGSPVKQSSGVMADSQQPDLALQL